MLINHSHARRRHAAASAQSEALITSALLVNAFHASTLYEQAQESCGVPYFRR